MDLTHPIANWEEVTPATLTQRLSRHGFIRAGTVTSIAKTESFTSSAAKWERLTLSFSSDYEGDVPPKLVLKIYRKDWFGGGVNEWTFYSELAALTPQAKVCPVYDCGIDRDRKDCHFLMADLSETHVEHPPKETGPPYEAIIDELLKFHVHWWGSSRLESWPFFNRHGGPLRMAQAIAEEDVRASCRAFDDDLKSFVQQAGDEFEPDWFQIVQRVIDRYPDAFLRRVTTASDITLLHGDAHLGNLFYPKDPEHGELILSDWETYKRGLGAYDLAYMLIHGTSERHAIERPLMDHYYQGLVVSGIEDYSRAQFEHDYRLSVIACVFCPLIWKRTFSMRSAVNAYEDWNCGDLL